MQYFTLSFPQNNIIMSFWGNNCVDTIMPLFHHVGAWDNSAITSQSHGSLTLVIITALQSCLSPPCPGTRLTLTLVLSAAGPAPPRRSPLTSLTMGRSHSQSIRDSLAELGNLPPSALCSSGCGLQSQQWPFHHSALQLTPYQLKCQPCLYSAMLMMKSWNNSCITGPLWGESSTHKRPVMRNFWCFCGVSLNKLLNKQPSCWVIWDIMMLTWKHINSLRSSDAIWWQRSESTLAQVMACCLTAQSHYLNQWWLMISKV